MGDGASAAPLTEAIWKLFLVFDEHLATEEAELAPLLVSAEFSAISRWSACTRSTASSAPSCWPWWTNATAAGIGGEIAEDVRWLVDSLRNDMSHEEKQFEVARDDGFVVDQCTG